MNTYEILIYIGLRSQWVEITGNSPQEAVDTFRQFSAAPVFAMRDADSKESVVDWE